MGAEDENGEAEPRAGVPGVKSQRSMDAEVFAQRLSKWVGVFSAC